MHNEVMIYKMTIEDVVQVEDIERECFSLPWSKEALLESLRLPHYIFVVAKMEEKVVGYGGAYVTYDEAQITNIAVKTDYRRLGIGSKIVEGIINESGKMGAKTILLEVRASNISAISIYKKAGFEKIGTRRNFYEKPVEDAVIMWKKEQ